MEGGNVNDWSRWESQPGRIRDGADASTACDHYRRYREDLSDLAALGQNAHRFSVEWSRIEPEEGRIDEDAIAHYRDVLAACHENGLEPLLTLQHFTLPLWLADRGGLQYAGAPARFGRFAALCAERLGDLVTWWTTINEPAILAVEAHLVGEFPPGGRSVRQTRRALETLLEMHAAAARAIRSVAAREGRRALVSIAHHERPVRPRRPSVALDRLVARIPDHVLNRWFLRSCLAGRVLPPVGAGRALAGLGGSLDYLGVNFYCEETASFHLASPGSGFCRLRPPAGLPLSTFGWAIDAPALGRALVALWRDVRLPMLVLENGVADRDDDLRPAFLVDHLAAVASARRAGADVRGYLHWTAMDNFEWAQGYTQRFGLFAVDRETLERRPKPSARVYERICRTGRVSGAVHEDLAPVGA